MLIPECVFPISKLCDSEQSRYTLGAVRLERKGTVATAIASDGRRLLTVQWDDSEPQGDSEEDKRLRFPAEAAGVDTTQVDGYEALIPQGVWDEAAKAAAKVRRMIRPALRNVVLDEPNTNGTVTMATYDGDTCRKLETKQMEGRFPHWQDSIPKYQELSEDDSKELGGLAVRITLDAKYLAEIVLTALKCASKEGDAIDLIVPLDACGPVLLEAEGETIVKGAVMPFHK